MTYEGGGHAIDFPLNMTNAQFREALRRLMRLGWTDAQSRARRWWTLTGSAR